MRSLAWVIALLASLPLSADEVLVLPGVARTAGLNGSFFRTSLFLTNPTTSAIDLRLRFSGQGAGTAEVRLLPATMTTYRDVLTDLFHVAADTAGAIFVESSGPRPVISARTYNDAPSGTYGQHIEAQSVAPLSAVNAAIYLPNDPSSRINLGIVNVSDRRITTRVDAEGFKTPVEVVVEAGDAFQMNRVDAVRSASSASPVTISSEQPAVVYASVVDNATSDAMFMTPQPAYVEQFLDGGSAAHATLLLANPSADAVTIDIEHYPGSANRTGTTSVSLDPFSQRQFSDFVRDRFNLPANGGFLHLTSTRPIVAWSRMFNDAPGGGTAGQVVSPIAPPDLIRKKAILHGLAENARFRTQVYFFNATTTSVGIKVTIIDPAGTVRGSLAVKTFGVSGRQAYSFPLFATEMGFPDMGEYYLLIEPTVPGAGYVWAALIDRASNDPTLIRPVLLD